MYIKEWEESIILETIMDFVGLAYMLTNPTSNRKVHSNTSR
jgi:hypothetical protein